MLKPTVMYGYETWSMTEKDEVMLYKWERNVLSKVYGYVTEK
jgi:hypothetical protein